MSTVAPLVNSIVLAALVATCTACGRSERPEQSEAEREPTRDRPSSPEEIWAVHCERCHGVDELEGVSAAGIREAIRTVSTMRRFEGRLRPEEIDGLARMLAGGSAGEDGVYTYRSAEECRRCHPQHVAEWAPSLHALAHAEVVYDRYFIKASVETGQQIETFCARCHTPIGVYDGTIPFARPPRGPGDTTVSAVAAEGVQCELCHTITSYEALENGRFVLRPSSKLLGPLENARSTFHDTELSALYRQPEYCGTCHNVTHPTNGIVLESTYTEWREGPYAREGVVCQDCHMTDGISERQAHPGKAATDGPDREHVSRHFFVGPNVIFGDAPGAAALHERSLKLLRGAGEVSIGDPVRRDGGLHVPIEVTNKRAGHFLPTGVTEIREVWLDVHVTDGAGTSRFRVGDLDERGDLDPEAIVYRTEVVDREGRVTTKFWNAVAKQRDHRIPPRGSVTEQVVVPADALAGASWPVTIAAALRYRSVAPAGLAEVDAPRDLVEIPVITIAEATRVVSTR